MALLVLAMIRVFSQGGDRGALNLNTKIFRGVEFPEIKEDLKKNFLFCYLEVKIVCFSPTKILKAGGFPERDWIERTLILKIRILLRGILKKLHPLLVLCS